MTSGLNFENGTFKSSLDLEVVGTFDVKGSRARYKRSVVISVDEEDRWESKMHPPDLHLLQGEEHQFLFRPSSMLKIEVRAHRSCLSGAFRRRFHIIGVATKKVVDLLHNNDAMLDLTDETGVKVADVKVNLISTPPADLLKKVNDAVASMGGTKFAAVSGKVDSVVSTAQAGYNDAQMIGDCIPALAQALQTAAKIVRTISEAHPILKVACTALLSAYEAVKAQQIQDDAVRGLAESLREMVGVANQNPDLLVVAGTDNVIEAISHVFLQVASVIDEYARLPFIGRTLRDALSEDMKTRIQQLQDRCKDLISKHDRRLTMQIKKTMAEGSQKFADDELLKKIKEWLDAPDPSKNYDNALEKHQENTCAWFINGRQFDDWKNNELPFIWVYGIPGCGKSVLWATAINHIFDHCHDKPSSAVAYFAFDSRDGRDGSKRFDGLIRSLVSQLTVQRRLVSDRLKVLCEKNPSRVSLESLRGVFHSIVDQFERVYMIIDALDECMNTEILTVLRWIEEVVKSPGGRLRLLVTSRPEGDFEISLGQLCTHGRVRVGEDAVNQDIGIYLDDMLKRQTKLASTSEEIKASVMKNARGMFRLAALQIEDLSKCHRWEEMKKSLDHPPKTLFEMYHQILNRLDPGERKDALHILQWLAFSTTSLNLHQLNDAVAVHFNSTEEPGFDPAFRYEDPQEWFRVCSGLIVGFKDDVKLAHVTVKEYLMSAESNLHTSERDSHALISKACLAYILQFESLDFGDGTLYKDFPLTDYAAMHLIFYVKSAGGDASDSMLQGLLVKLFQSGDPLFASWVLASDTFGDFNFWASREKVTKFVYSPLYYALSFGVESVVRPLLDSGMDPNVRGVAIGPDFETVLHAAVDRGFEAIVKLLLKAGADPNAQGGRYGTALQAAAYGGSEATVKFLLEAGADPNAQGGEYGTALQAAAAQGSEATVKLLLEAGANPNAQGGRYGTALQAAAAQGSEATVKLLLEAGADPNVQGGAYGNALAAARHDDWWKVHNDTVIKLLLDYGATDW